MKNNNAASWCCQIIKGVYIDYEAHAPGLSKLLYYRIDRQAADIQIMSINVYK